MHYQKAFYREEEEETKRMQEIKVIVFRNLKIMEHEYVLSY